MKPTAIILALLMLLTTACGEAELGNDTSAEDTAKNTDETVETDVFVGLPDKTYDGKKFNMLVRSSTLDQFWLEEATGEVLDDAVYMRNIEVEQRFDVELNAIEYDGSWDARDEYIGLVRSSVMSDDGAFDLIEGSCYTMSGLYGDRVFMNLWDVPNLRLEESWWSPIATETLTVNGKLYGTTGDLSLALWNNMLVMFFNKEYSNQLGLESQYERVKNGTWTLEAMKADVKGAAHNINGDDAMDENDRWGLITYDSLWADNLQVAFGASITKRENNGDITLDYNNEKMADIYSAVMSLVKENPDVFYVTQGMNDIINVTRGIFTSGNALYLGDTLETCLVMRDSDTEFGIIPCPKYDEAQDNYYTTARSGCTMFMIPSDVRDADFAGLITEALAVCSQKRVIPAYYDVTLKEKGARDDESADMLDIIRDGLYLDFAKEFSMQLNNGGMVIRFAISQDVQYSSYIASRQTSYEAAFEKFLEAYE